ncbi:MAG: hypothetical protein ACMUFK_04070, partial [Thermoplasmatota archaeon]
TIVIVIAALVLTLMVVAVAFIYILKRENIRDVEWDNEDDEIAELDEIDLDVEEEIFEFEDEDLEEW